MEAYLPPKVFFPLDLVTTQPCYEEFFFRLNLLHAECLKLTALKGIGYAVVVASSILKLPVILNMLKARSAKGLSESSLVLESTALASSFVQSYVKKHPFSTWGEVVIIFIQDMVIYFMMQHFNAVSPARTFLIFLAIMLFTAGCYAVPAEYTDYLMLYSTVCSMSSRVPQILTNYRNKHTGVMSAVTQGLMCVGTVVRLATVVMETKDMAKSVSIFINFFLTAAMLVQIFIYWDASVKVLQQSAEEGANARRAASGKAVKGE